MSTDKSKKLYGKSPKIEKDKDGKASMAKEPSEAEGESMGTEGNPLPGSEGKMPVHASHEAERKSMHKRHEEEQHAMHERHEKDMTEMHKRHEKATKTDKTGDEISKTEETK